MPWGDVPRAACAAPDGILPVNKDAGVTSHDVVGAVRRLAGTRKVGHAGTLDPMATGLLILGIGRGTKLLTYLSGKNKTYEARICLGVRTDTEDREGKIVSLPDARLAARLKMLGGEEIDAALRKFTGRQMQVPSRVSAKKIGGRRAYDLARAGEEVRLSPRPVTVESFLRTGPTVFSQETVPGFATLEFPVSVRCTAGTYIRALARDLGEYLGVGAHLRMLHRSSVGGRRSSRALGVKQYAQMTAAGRPLPVLPLSAVCKTLFPVVYVGAEEARALRFGQFIAMREPGECPDGKTGFPFAAYTEDGTAVALLSARGDKLKPCLLLTP